MGNPKCTLPKEERAEIFRMFRGSLTADEEDTLRGMFPQYLFFQNAWDDTGLDLEPDRNTRRCFCTSCREGFDAVRGNYARGRLHGEPCDCPVCGARLEGRAVMKYRYDMPSLQSWIKAAVCYAAPDGGLLVEAGDCRRSFNHDELAGVIEWYPKARYYFYSGKAMMWKEVIMSWACRPEDVRTAWQPAETVHDPFNPNVFADYYGEYSMIGLPEALAHSALKYCRIGEFYHYEYSAEIENGDAARWMVKYLGWYTVCPQMEFAVRLGLNDAVRDLTEYGKKNARILDWTARTPAEFLRMGKAEARIFLKAEMSFGDLKAWKETAPKLSFDGFMTMVDLAGGCDNLRAVAGVARKEGIELKRAVRYIRHLVPECASASSEHVARVPARRDAPPVSRIIGIWKDYLDMAHRMGYDLTEQTVLMPKDLQQRHDTAAELLGEMERLDEMKRYKARRRRLEKKYGFTMDGLRIVIPVSAEEIVLEGKTLRHCVGGYAKRHIDGTTTILFLRKARTPGRSYLTIELYEDKGKTKIRQIHGYRNEHYGKKPVRPELRHAAFLDAWLGWVNAGSKRDRKGQPVLPENNEEVKTA